MIYQNKSNKCNFNEFVIQAKKPIITTEEADEGCSNNDQIEAVNQEEPCNNNQTEAVNEEPCNNNDKTEDESDFFSNTNNRKRKLGKFNNFNHRRCNPSHRT